LLAATGLNRLGFRLKLLSEIERLPPARGLDGAADFVGRFASAQISNFFATLPR
jgi:hypothetical protein